MYLQCLKNTLSNIWKKFTLLRRWIRINVYYIFKFNAKAILNVKILPNIYFVEPFKQPRNMRIIIDQQCHKSTHWLVKVRVCTKLIIFCIWVIYNGISKWVERDDKMKWIYLSKCLFSSNIPPTYNAKENRRKGNTGCLNMTYIL